MLCILIQHTHLHEIQTITQLFFPNERFTFAYSPEALLHQQGYAVLSRLSDHQCDGEVYKDGVPLAAYSLSLSDTVGLSAKRSLMLALFHALKTVININTPWGALTGIRPSKLVRQWLAEGWSEQRIIDTLTHPYQCNESKAHLALQVAQAENRLTDQINASAAAPHPTKTPLGLYISLPFCPSRCLYCSFNTCHKTVTGETHDLYLRALAEECKQTAQAARECNGVFTSVYIGGGTPTVLSEKRLAFLLDTVVACFGPLMTEAEYTVEAGRPDSLTPEKLRLMRDHGVTRIAVNPQTLNDRTLALIGRGHTAETFFRAFEMARAAGFNHINADIIAGLPGEKPEDMQYTMQGLTALAPENITVHTLAVKRASRLNEHLKDYHFPSAAETEAMLEIAREACDAAGLAPYYLYRQKNMVGLFENVGYSLPGYECLYNIGMMAETQTILAAGAGAVHKYVNGDRIERVFNVKNPDVYTERILKAIINE